MVIPKKHRDVRMTVSHKQLNDTSRLQVSCPSCARVRSWTLWGKRTRVFSVRLRSRVSSFHQISAHGDTGSLAACSAPTDLFTSGWLRLKRQQRFAWLVCHGHYREIATGFGTGCGEPPRRCIRVRLQIVRRRLTSRPSCPLRATTQAQTPQALIPRKLGSARRAHIYIFLGRSISSAGVRPNAERLSALTLSCSCPARSETAGRPFVIPKVPARYVCPTGLDQLMASLLEEKIYGSRRR